MIKHAELNTRDLLGGLVIAILLLRHDGSRAAGASVGISAVCATFYYRPCFVAARLYISHRADVTACSI